MNFVHIGKETDTRLTPLGSVFHLSSDGVVTTVQQAAVDGERSQFGVQIQLGVVVVHVALQGRVIAV